MKKLFSLMLALSMALALCVPAYAHESHTVTGEEVPIYAGGKDSGGKMTLYFLDGVTDLPYMEAGYLCTLLNRVFGSETLGVSFTMETEGPVVTYTRHHEGSPSDGIYATFDFDRSEITFRDYNLFLMRGDASTILDVTGMKYFNAQGEPALMQKIDKGTFDRYGDELVLPLADYGIELVYQPVENGCYLIPLQTISDFIFANGRGLNLYFNGQGVFLAAQIVPGDEAYYAAPTGERSEALTEYGYGELCMMLDYLYGQKEIHEIDSFDQLFQQVVFDQILKGPEVLQADGAIARLISDFLDDGHSGMHAFSYLAGDIDYKAPYGTSLTRLADQMTMYAKARAKAFPDGIPGYQEIGNTAYITFDKFALGNEKSGEDFYLVDDPADFEDTDTIGLIIKAHAMITRENSPIENVILDLSCNGGGDADTAIFVIAWFLGEASIGMKDTMTGAVCASTYRCDANRDREFDERDTVEDKNLFVLTSPYSFSCGNLVPCALKNSGKVTVLGRTSGGGSCVVLNTSSAWGTSFQISGTRRLSFIKNGAYYDIDRGADPDFVITSPAKYYDREALTDYINSLY